MTIKTTASKAELKEKVFTSKYYKHLQQSLQLKGETEVFVYNKYKLRTNCDTAIIVTIEDYEEYRLVHYIVSGHKSGLLRFDLGVSVTTETDFTYQLQESGLDFEILEKQQSL